MDVREGHIGKFTIARISARHGSGKDRPVVGVRAVHGSGRKYRARFAREHKSQARVEVISREFIRPAGALPIPQEAKGDVS